MKAVAFTRSLPISEPDSLVDIELPDPELRARDLLVEIEAISVNPADAKRRMRVAADGPVEPFVLGYDAVGTVRETGGAATLFRPGDKVWYAGDATRPGSYAALQAVDERIVGRAPRAAPASDAASLPLTSLTAWEMLFDRLGAKEGEAGEILVIGGAGGVGSITIQLARKLTGLTVVATASRLESVAWCRSLGAHDVVDHRDLVASATAAGYERFKYIVQYADTAQHWDAMCALVAPQGRIGTIVETPEKIDVTKLQGKSAALVWELMFTRAMFETEDMGEQGAILNRVAAMVDAREIRTTAREKLSGLSSATLKKAHEMIETSAMIGKIVIEY